MKKITFFILILILSFSIMICVTGCGSKTNNQVVGKNPGSLQNVCSEGGIDVYLIDTKEDFKNAKDYYKIPKKYNKKFFKKNSVLVVHYDAPNPSYDVTYNVEYSGNSTTIFITAKNTLSKGESSICVIEPHTFFIGVKDKYIKNIEVEEERIFNSYY